MDLFDEIFDSDIYLLKLGSRTFLFFFKSYIFWRFKQYFNWCITLWNLDCPSAVLCWTNIHHVEYNDNLSACKITWDLRVHVKDDHNIHIMDSDPLIFVFRGRADTFMQSGHLYQPMLKRAKPNINIYLHYSLERNSLIILS